jgi:hypothetical protein
MELRGMSTIGISIDSKAVLANLSALEARIPKADEIGREMAANELLRLSQMEVPHDEGTLQNSGVVEKVGDDIIVGYHAPYAARLHEHPEYHFQKGRKGKYLEDPTLKNAEVLGLKYVEGAGGELLNG